MDKYDLEFMNVAIDWAKGCHPNRENIPKVGAIIAVGEEPIGLGRRGIGRRDLANFCDVPVTSSWRDTEGVDVFQSTRDR